MVESNTGVDIKIEKGICHGSLKWKSKGWGLEEELLKTMETGSLALTIGIMQMKKTLKSKRVKRQVFFHFHFFTPTPPYFILVPSSYYIYPAAATLGTLSLFIKFGTLIGTMAASSISRQSH